MKNNAARTPANTGKLGRCQFSASDGRRCRMPRWARHRTLCLHHARREEQLLAVEDASRELVSLSGEFKTASDVNHVLGKLFSLVAGNRIPRRNAVTLAYISQLLLQSLPSVQNEIRHALGHDAWRSTLQTALDDAQPPSAE